MRYWELLGMNKLLFALGIVLLAACAPEPETPTRPASYFPPINHIGMPRPVVMRNVDFYVVTPATYDEFVTRYTNENGELVYIAMSTADYENMAFNIAELRRYIEQQKAVIVYYQRSIDELQKLNTYPTEE